MFDVSAKTPVIANAVKQSLEPVHSRLEIPAFAGMTGCARLAGDCRVASLLAMTGFMLLLGLQTTPVIANAVKQSLKPVRSRLEIPAFAGMTCGLCRHFMLNRSSYFVGAFLRVVGFFATVFFVAGFTGDLAAGFLAAGFFAAARPRFFGGGASARRF